MNFQITRFPNGAFRFEGKRNLEKKRYRRKELGVHKNPFCLGARLTGVLTINGVDVRLALRFARAATNWLLFVRRRHLT